jgi:hypothetical protein
LDTEDPETASRFGGGDMALRTSEEPDLEVEALLPCFAIKTRDDAIMEDVVDTLKVEWPSPPVPTISHYTIVSNTNSNTIILETHKPAFV